MKKYFIAILLSLSLSSCHFLEVEKTGRSDIQSYFSEPESLDAAIIGVYNLLYKLQDSYMFVYPEITADLAELSKTTSEWRKVFDFSTSESEETEAVGYIWKNSHEIILNTCEIIEYGTGLLNTFPQKKQQINSNLAQAYFVRALVTLQLSLIYGQTYTYTPDGSHLGSPVLTSFPSLSSNIARGTVKNAYGQVISDLDTAISLWDDYSVSDVHFASKPAAEALLARVYLYMADYENAVKYSANVIGSSSLSLTPTDKYFEMFCDINYDGSEVIMRLDGYDLSTNMSNMYDALKAPRIYPSSKLRQMFLTHPEGMSDVRELMISYSDLHYSGTTCMKYSITEYDLEDKERHYDPILLRLSEMYLIRAESLCKLGRLSEAADDIATLQARAYGVEKNAITIDYSSEAKLDELIMMERCKELCFEGHRLYDITRRHESLKRGDDTGSIVKSMDFPDDRFILPIPLVELEANPDMKSNPINKTQQ